MANYDANATPNMNFFIPIQADRITCLLLGMFSQRGLLYNNPRVYDIYSEKYT